MRNLFQSPFKMDEPVSNLLGQIKITNKPEEIAYQSLMNELIAWGKSQCHSNARERGHSGQPCLHDVQW